MELNARGAELQAPRFFSRTLRQTTGDMSLTPPPPLWLWGGGVEWFPRPKPQRKCKLKVLLRDFVLTFHTNSWHMHAYDMHAHACTCMHMHAYACICMHMRVPAPPCGSGGGGVGAFMRT